MMKRIIPICLLKAVLLTFAVLMTTSCGKKEKSKPEPVPAPQPPPVPQPVEQADIYDAIRAGDTTAFVTWLTGTQNINEQNREGQTALIVAAEENRAPFVRDLINYKANLNFQDMYGRTALHVAAQDNNLEILQLLLDAGINPTLVDTDGLSAKDLAVIREYAEAASMIADAIEHYLAVSTDMETGTGDEREALSPIELLSTDFRIWTSARGDQLDAAFIQNVFDTVILQARDGTMLRININRLSADDQKLVRKLEGMDPHALASARASRPSGMSTTRRPAGNSLASRIGRESGWTVLENCRLLSNDSNDGDSFHVKHEGKEYIFRLYFVDAAETDNSFPDRVREQAAYFNLSTDETLRLGREASKFSRSILAGAPFTVYTRWTDARGNSQLKRHFALVETPLGDLDELLTREGLVRLYGLTIGGKNGRRKSEQLTKLEREARREHVGAWTK